MANKRHSTWRTPEGGLSLGYSGFSLYRACPRKFWWQYLAGSEGTGIVKEQEEFGFALQYGKLWHHLWREWAIKGPLNEEGERAAYVEWCRVEDFDPREAGLASLFAQVSNDLTWYWGQTEGMQITVLFAEEELKVQATSPRTGLVHELRGTPDLIAELDGDWGGGKYIVDHKTYSAISRDNKLYVDPNAASLERNRHSRQFPCYAGLWNLMNPESPIVDALINYVPQQATQVLKIQSTRRGTQKLLKLHRDFVFMNTDYCNHQVLRWLATCDEIVEGLEAPNPEEWFALRENGGECVNGWGRVCSFAMLCESDQGMREDLVRGAWQPRVLKEAA